MPSANSWRVNAAVIVAVTALLLSAFWWQTRTPAKAGESNFWLAANSHTVFTVSQPYYATPDLDAYNYYSGYAGAGDSLYVSVRTTSVDGCGLSQLIVDGYGYPGSSAIQLDGGQVHNIFAQYAC